MALADEIEKMEEEGKGEEEIMGNLKSKGVPEREIAEAIDQGRIKAAVSSDESAENYPAYSGGGQDFSQEPLPPTPSPGGAGFNQGGYTTEYSEQGEYPGMQPSMLTGQEAEYPASPEQNVGGEYSSEGYYPVGGGEAYQDYGGAYPQYQPYQEGISSDVITEISEQVVSEKLSALHDKLEKVIDMKTVFEARITSLDDRLKRMEKLTDQMQLSILKKVGEYLTDVQDVKKELEETQKSFVSLHKKRHEGHKHHKK